MKVLLRSTLLLCILSAALPVSAQGSYFPAHALNGDAAMDLFQAEWYTRHLQALQERSLLLNQFRPGAQVYRFLWLRTFDHPITVRLTIKLDGTGTLTTKIASGAGGYSPGKLITSRTRDIGRIETAAFLRKVESSGFWSLHAEQGQPANDGSEWIVEGVSPGRYHVASRWTPTRGAVYQIGSALAFELANIAVPRDRIY